MDHVIDTRMGRDSKTPVPAGSMFIDAFRDEAHRQNITLFDIGVSVKAYHMSGSLNRESHCLVATGMTAIVTPGSTAVRRAAEAEGLDKVFIDAGFQWRESGCGLCFYAGGDRFTPGTRVISSTNRNFENRQAPGVRTHLDSPVTVAASAIAGCIIDPRQT